MILFNGISIFNFLILKSQIQTIIKCFYNSSILAAILKLAGLWNTYVSQTLRMGMKTSSIYQK